MKDQLLVTVVSQRGDQVTQEFPSDAELSAVAERARAALLAPPMQPPPQLLHVRTGRRLSPAVSLLAAGVRSRDELLLLPPPPPTSPSASSSSSSSPVARKPSAPSPADASADASDLSAAADASDGSGVGGDADRSASRSGGINLEDIEAATRSLEPRPPPPAPQPEGEEASGVDAAAPTAAAAGPQRISGQAFARSLTPTLVTLIDACQRLLCVHPDAEKLMQLVRSGSAAPAAPRPEPDLGLVRQLTEMGFPEAQARRALALAHNSLADATDCLLAGEEALAAAEAPPPQSSSTLTESKRAEDEDETEPAAAASADAAKPGFVEPLSVSAMLDLFRQYSRAQFRPNQGLRLRLLDMGFEEPAVTDALRVHNNDEAQALETLLGGLGGGGQSRGEQQERQSEEAALAGLDPDSPLCKALMASPAVQLALCQPVTLLAFLSILDNPLTLASWQNQVPGFQSLIRTIASLYYEHSAGGEGPHSWIS